MKAVGRETGSDISESKEELSQKNGAQAPGLWLTRHPNWACSCSLAQLCLTLCDPMDCSPPGSSVHDISQTRILECVAVSFSSDLG